MASKRSERIEGLIEKVKDFPKQPGVYLMKNKAEKVIYVGKAKVIRNRVRSYFTESKDISPKTKFLVSHIQDIEYILTKTEVEAFLLEASLIKKYRPRYNIRLKDDKAYPYIKYSNADTFPRLYVARKVRNDGSIYFGPYTSGYAVKETIRFLNKTFMIRDCKDAFMKTRKRPCMTHQIGRCGAPCVDYINEEEYRKDMKGALSFLRGKDKNVVSTLEERMWEESDRENYEAAARIRDSIESVKKILEQQTVVNDAQDNDRDQDVFGFFGDHRGTLIESLHIRKGRVIGHRSNFFAHINAEDSNDDPREWFVSFLNQYYQDNIIPDELVLPVDLGRDLNQLLQAVLEERSERKIKVFYGGSSRSQSLIHMATNNAQSHFMSQVSKEEKRNKALKLIQDKFHLPDFPYRIECYDISNFQGKDSVASQVVYENGEPSKENYRRYKIKTVEGANDYASMAEVLSRRFEHKEYEDPQLIVIDGGKGQLRAAVEVLKEIGRPDIPVVGLAKARTKGEFSDQEVQETEERFYLPGRSNPVTFKTNSTSFKILVSLRDEAHRFAIEFHRKLRDKTSFASQLDEIVGLGEKKKKALLKAFGDVERVSNASAEQLSFVKGITQKDAQNIFKFFNTHQENLEDDSEVESSEDKTSETE